MLPMAVVLVRVPAVAVVAVVDVPSVVPLVKGPVAEPTAAPECNGAIETSAATPIRPNRAVIGFEVPMILLTMTSSEASSTNARAVSSFAI